MIQVISKGLCSIAFGCISTVEFRFPKHRAAEIALSTIQTFLEEHKDVIHKMIINGFQDEGYRIYKDLLIK